MTCTLNYVKLFEAFVSTFCICHHPGQFDSCISHFDIWFFRHKLKCDWLYLVEIGSLCSNITSCLCFIDGFCRNHIRLLSSWINMKCYSQKYIQTSYVFRYYYNSFGIHNNSPPVYQYWNKVIFLNKWYRWSSLQIWFINLPFRYLILPSYSRIRCTISSGRWFIITHI